MTGNYDHYAQTLIDVAERMQHGRVVALGANMAHKPRVVQRIDRIITLGGRVKPRISRVAAIAVVVLLAVGTAVLGTSTLYAASGSDY